MSLMWSWMHTPRSGGLRCGVRDRHTGNGRTPDGTDRGQLSLSAVEAAIGVVFVLTVAATFGVGLPDPGIETADLDATATDVATILVNEHGAGQETTGTDGPPLPVAISSAERFAAEQETIAVRAESIVPDRLQYHIRTPHGTIGMAPPRRATVGHSTVQTRYGEIVVEIWR